ncbi:MAG: WhiB family transcriptional regulator [Actinomycetota bacterium]|nr:WhiB family transcriptional regulator [Actinomycetota bacterium]MDH5225649.1 WhiB family transcriptional regulator [Actinomycetota bacterium]
MIEPKFKRDPGETWWIEQASCIGEDPELFFPIGTSTSAMEQTARAIGICNGCPVRADCLAWALDTCQDAGVWGGLGEEDRREIRRARRRAAAAAATEPHRADDELVGVG